MFLHQKIIEFIFKEANFENHIFKAICESLIFCPENID